MLQVIILDPSNIVRYAPYQVMIRYPMFRVAVDKELHNQISGIFGCAPLNHEVFILKSKLGEVAVSFFDDIMTVGTGICQQR